MRRIKYLLIGFFPFVLATVAFGALASAQPAPEVPNTSGCVTDLSRLIEPGSILFGGNTQVSLVVSSTCPSNLKPIDLVILADESHSMARVEPDRQVDPIATRETPPTPLPPGTPEPPPTLEPPPTIDPGGGGSGTPDPGGPGDKGSEPPFCNPKTGGDSGLPTPTLPPDPRTPIPPPTPIDPGGIGGPTPGNDIVKPDINALEPAGAIDMVREEKSWVRDFMKRPEIERDLANGRLRVAFVSFNDRARVRIPLTDAGSKIIGGANRMRGDEITRINQGLRTAEGMFNGSGSRKDEDRVQILVILSDFQFCQRDMKRPDSDLQVIAVGVGVRNFDRRKMYDMATDSKYVVDYRDVRKVVDLYENVIAPGGNVKIDNLTVRDDLHDNMSLLPNSVQPPTATLSGQLITWEIQNPVLPMTFTYRVEPLEWGLLPVSKQGSALWVDNVGMTGQGLFPDGNVDVIPPTPTPTPTFTPTPTPTNTPTPTATFTPTPTPTPQPKPLYLPFTLRETKKECIPSEQTVDVALIIDTSTSMQETTHLGGAVKLDAAILASIGLVNAKKPDDQITVIGFNTEAHMMTLLTKDKAQIISALQRLPDSSDTGTAMQTGLSMGHDELTSERHLAGNHRSLVLLTDGRATAGTQPVRDVAAAIKADGIKVLTIGLGSDVDTALLTDIASAPNYYYPAPSVEDLERIYREIAYAIPCP